MALAIVGTAQRAQAQNFEWAVADSGPDDVKAKAVAADANGNVYVVGSFNGTATLNNGESGQTTVSSTGNADIFVKKLDANGNIVWGHSFGGTSKDEALDVSVDAAGNVLVVGTFRNTVNFSPGTNNYILTSKGSSDAFVMKLDPNGTTQWVQTFGGTSLDEAYGVVCDASSNVYVTGLFRSTASVGSDPNSSVTSNGGRDAFVLKLAADGSFQWIRHFGGTSDDRAFDIDLAPNGDIVTTGIFKGSVDFDPGTGTAMFSSHGLNDVFVERLDANGDFVWAQAIQGDQDNKGTTVKTDANGNVFVGGEYSGTVTPEQNGGHSTTAYGNKDGFLVKYHADGSLAWIKSIGGFSNEGITDLFVSQQDEVFLTGYFFGAFDIDPTQSLTATASQDIFFAKYDNDGNFQTALSYGGVSIETPEKIWVDAATNIYTVGTYYGADVDFDPGIQVSMLANQGLYDGYTQKLSMCTQADVPAFSTSADVVCAGSPVQFDIVSGNLNGAAQWIWRKDDCNGTVVGQGTSVTVHPTETTTYYIAGEGGCVTAPNCVSFTVTVLPTDTLEEQVSVCEGKAVTFPDGSTINNVTSDMLHVSTLSNYLGCDSIVVTNVSVVPPMETELETMVCQGEDYTFADGTVQTITTDPVTHTSVLPAVNTCDSNVVETVTPIILDATVSLNGSTLSVPNQVAEIQWMDCGTQSLVPGANGHSFTPTASGTYAPVVSYGNCSVTGECTQVIVTGTQAPDWQAGVNLYPNPVSDYLNVDLGRRFAGGSVVVRNGTGEAIATYPLDGRRHLQVDMRGVPAGLYFLQVTEAESTAVFKFVK